MLHTDWQSHNNGVFASVGRRIVVAADGCLIETYALIQRDGGNDGCSHLQPQRDDAEFFDFINDMLQQRSPQAAALVGGIDGDIEQRYQEVLNCLLTMERFECNRLR